MGNKQMQGAQNLQIRQNAVACYDDMQCKNINANKSTPNKLVYVCPGAKCDNGTCKCGKKCKRDPYTGICCSDVKRDRSGNTFCIERFGSCDIPDKYYGNVLVKGEIMCDLIQKIKESNGQ